MIDLVAERIVSILLSCRGPMTSKTIANEIGMSESSVRHRMSRIRHFIDSCSGSVSLRSSRGQGFWIQGASHDRQEVFHRLQSDADRSGSFAYRRNYMLGVLTHPRSNYTIQLFADDLCVSRNVVESDLRKLERWFRSYNIELKKTPNIGVRIIGDESSIREAIIESARSLLEGRPSGHSRPDYLDIRVSATFFNYFRLAYSNCELYRMQRLAIQIERRLHMRFSDTSFIYLIEYLTLSRRRMEQGCHCTLDAHVNDAESISPYYETALEAITDMMPDGIAHGVAIGAVDAETRCLAGKIELYGTSRCLHRRNQDAPIADETADRNQRMAAMLLFYIVRTSRIGVRVDAAMVEKIAGLFRKKAMLKSYEAIKSQYLVRDIRNRLSALYAVTLYYAAFFKEHLGFTLRAADIAYIVMLLDNDRPVTDSVQGVFGSSFDRDLSRYLVNKIENAFPQLKISKIVNIEELLSMDRSIYDIAISTVLSDETDIVKVSRRVDDEDLTILAEELSLRRRKLIPASWNSAQLFREGLTMSGVTVRTHEAALRYASDLLFAHGDIEDGFFEQIVEQESVVSSSVGNGVAVVSGVGVHVRRSSVSIVLLRRPVEWPDGEMVDLLFVFTACGDDQGSMADALGTMYELIEYNSRTFLSARPSSRASLI